MFLQNEQTKMENVILLASYYSIFNCFILHSFNPKYKFYFITHPASFFETIVIISVKSSFCKVVVTSADYSLNLQRPFCFV